jgi:hypothetical protein
MRGGDAKRKSVIAPHRANAPHQRPGANAVPNGIGDIPIYSTVAEK